jgi:ATP-binding cassette, subfamily B, bacterial
VDAQATSGKVKRPGTLWVLARAAGAWRRNPGLAAVAAAALVIQQLFSAGLALSIKLIIEDVSGHEHRSGLARLLILLSGGFVLTALAAVAGERAAALAAGRISDGLRRKLYDHLLRLPPVHQLGTSSVDVLALYQGNVKAVEAGYTQGFLDTAVLVIHLGIAVPVMCWLDWQLTAAAVTTLLVVVVEANLLQPWVMHSVDRSSDAETRWLRTVQDTIHAHQFVRAFNLEDALARRFNTSLAEYGHWNIRNRVAAAALGSGSSLAVLAIQVGMVVAGAELAAHQHLSVGSLIAFVTLLGLLARNVFDFIRRDLPMLALAARKSPGILNFLATPAAVTDSRQAMELPATVGALRFEGVSFGYLSGHQAVRDLSFEIQPGTSVAIVGSNGSGKSALLNLAMRLYDPDSGRVLVDGVDLRQVRQDSYRSQLGVVLQDTFVFDDTVRENVRIGCPGADDAAVETAIRQAQLHETIVALPQGYDSTLGEGGGRLSGGQRQRLAIARALVRNPQVLLLDEVATALDPATEAAVNATLAELSKGRTVISVTHRLASARHADHILVLDAGRLVEQGVHEQLVTAGGTYQGLWEKQAGLQVSRDGRRATVTGKRLRHITLFADLSDDVLDRIADQFDSEYFEADQVVVACGEPGDRFYLIARGEVAITVPGHAGGEEVLNHLSDGDNFGEVALLRDSPRMATVRTVAPSIFLTMGRDHFLELVAANPELTRTLQHQMVRAELCEEEWRQSVDRPGFRPGAVPTPGKPAPTA